MSRPTWPSLVFFRRESMDSGEGTGLPIDTARAGLESRGGAWTPPRGGGESGEEVVPVKVDQSGPGQDAHEAPERQERRKGNALLASAPALAEEDRHTSRAAGREGGQERRRHRSAQEQPHHAGQLDVTHPHSGWIGKRGRQQAEKGRRAG